ncbi:hypothetical protein PVAP13_8KG063700 [Panicum virgatum]|uniref:Uncharacterized protein n=1 Tax=Panicum virgatum TaxID=38727 RepID=A0A8T0PIM2_PANVG|nr:hypothetical protein PVAP13_8KG063700 [Panicum virgatum]
MPKEQDKVPQRWSLCQKHIVCSNHGHRENELSQKDIARTGCEARGLVLVGRGFGQRHYYTNGIAGQCLFINRGVYKIQPPRLMSATSYIGRLSCWVQISHTNYVPNDKL